jgi:hypothetical protein
VAGHDHNKRIWAATNRLLVNLSALWPEHTISFLAIPEGNLDTNLANHIQKPLTLRLGDGPQGKLQNRVIGSGG